jgi:hypothetical protein
VRQPREAFHQKTKKKRLLEELALTASTKSWDYLERTSTR